MMPPIDSQADTLPVALFTTDDEGRLTGGNGAYRALMPSSALALGSPPWSTAPPHDREVAERLWHVGRAVDVPLSIEFRVHTPDGTERWIHTEFRRGPAGYEGIARDVSEEVRHRRTAERLESLFDTVDDAVVVLDREGRATLVNGAARRLVGASDSDDIMRQPFARSLLESLRHQVPRDIIAPGGTGTLWQGEVGYRGPDGVERTLMVQLVVERSHEGGIESYAAAISDITAQRALQDELAHQATHDSLTGLPNRALFVRTLADAIDRARTNRSTLGVLFVDLDNLKDVNDSIGHEYGDSLLAAIAQRLRSATRPSDVVARIGGDEFVVLCEGIGDTRTAHAVAERIRHAITGRMTLLGADVATSASIGVALASASALDGATSDDLAQMLMRNADIAMYHAKLHGRSRVEMFTDEMRLAAHERLELAGDLERASARDELLNVYMPIASPHDGRIVAAEALVRWRHPQRGELTPPTFLDIALDRGLIVTIGDGVLRRACIDLRRWIDAGLVEPSFRVHVNVSTRELLDHGIVDRVMSAIRDSGLSPSQIALEFTESAIDPDDSVTLRTLHALSRQGVRLALDDFGSGAASLTALTAMPVDHLKIDEALVRRLGETAADSLVRAVIQLAHALDMMVVAEWVTSERQAERLAALGCDLLQGHHVGAPVSADDMASLFGLRPRPSH